MEASRPRQIRLGQLIAPRLDDAVALNHSLPLPNGRAALVTDHEPNVKRSGAAATWFRSDLDSECNAHNSRAIVSVADEPKGDIRVRVRVVAKGSGGLEMPHWRRFHLAGVAGLVTERRSVAGLHSTAMNGRAVAGATGRQAV